MTTTPSRVLPERASSQRAFMASSSLLMPASSMAQRGCLLSSSLVFAVAVGELKGIAETLGDIDVSWG